MLVTMIDFERLVTQSKLRPAEYYDVM